MATYYRQISHRAKLKERQKMKAKVALKKLSSCCFILGEIKCFSLTFKSLHIPIANLPYFNINGSTCNI